MGEVFADRKLGEGAFGFVCKAKHQAGIDRVIKVHAAGFAVSMALRPEKLSSAISLLPNCLRPRSAGHYFPKYNVVFALGLLLAEQCGVPSPPSGVVAAQVMSKAGLGIPLAEVHYSCANIKVLFDEVFHKEGSSCLECLFL